LIAAGADRVSASLLDARDRVVELATLEPRPADATVPTAA
jgi:hypothetical protein